MLAAQLHGINPGDPLDHVEVLIGADDLPKTIVEDSGRMDGVTDPKIGKVSQHAMGSVHIDLEHGEDFLAKLLHVGKGAACHVIIAEGVIAVEDLLKDLHAGDDLNGPGLDPPEDLDTRSLIRVLFADRIHQDVGIEEIQLTSRHGRSTSS